MPPNWCETLTLRGLSAANSDEWFVLREMPCPSLWETYLERNALFQWALVPQEAVYPVEAPAPATNVRWHGHGGNSPYNQSRLLTNVQRGRSGLVVSGMWHGVHRSGPALREMCFAFYQPIIGRAVRESNTPEATFKRTLTVSTGQDQQSRPGQR